MPKGSVKSRNRQFVLGFAEPMRACFNYCATSKSASTNVDPKGKPSKDLHPVFERDMNHPSQGSEAKTDRVGPVRAASWHQIIRM